MYSKTIGRFVLTLALIAILGGSTLSIMGQVGKSQGVIDPNVATEKELLALPHMTPAVVKALMEKRPFAGITALNAFLLEQKLTPQQTAEFYVKAFIPINLNTATREEILLVPGAGTRMAREFPEYRPWKTFAQFDREIGKYVGAAETTKLAQYVFIPINLNTATDADFLTIPGVNEKLVKEFKDHRPWKTVEQFRTEIGKSANAKEVARLERYFVIQ